ncbi:hypothetical protein CVT25_003665 [Psilocybe cyanescens]|uniref:Uncharacterized protein n=1 Tax=Psilocybe cyanescens TaxID=93625 RepID=A0A409XQN5_PSICY|nr:hypothetical protein CVT25_003665 [Psilocybe cyanescens]
MPRRFIQPDLSGYKIEALAIVISAIAYGIVLMLFFNTFWLVVRTKEQHMRKLLLGYICVMVSLSTGAMVQEIIFMMRDVLPKTTEDARSSMADLSSLRGIPLSFPFTTWGADGVLVSRPFNLIICSHWDLLKTNMATSHFLGGDLILFIPSRVSRLSPGTGVSVIAMSTLLCNSFLSGLVVSRILHYDRSLKRSGLSNHDSGYNRIVAMCIESSVLIVVVSLVFIIFAYGSFSLYISFPLFILPHICVISPLLIIFRVAQGRAYSFSSINNSRSRNEESDIQFRHSIAAS